VHHSGMSDLHREAVAVAEVALALAGHELDLFTRAIIARMGRGEVGGDQVAQAVIDRFVGERPRGRKRR
jgi:hypothetical protein